MGAERLDRHTFLVQVHPGGISTVENLRTRERVRVEELGTLGDLVERWVEEAGAGNRRDGRTAKADEDSSDKA